GALGLGAIAGIAGVPAGTPRAVHGRLAPSGPGKDSASGHRELMGAPAPAPAPTYPDGFPPAIVGRLEAVIQQTFCCNRPYNGVQAIDDFGEHHLRTGELILYTSQDSVLQVAAHADVLAEDQLREVCRRIRKEMRGPDAVERVIARPFAGAPGAFA